MTRVGSWRKPRARPHMTFKKVMAQAARPLATHHGHGAGRQTAHDTQKRGVMAQAQKGEKFKTLLFHVLKS